MPQLIAENEVEMRSAVPADTGLATYHSRVERWECDYNNHWNVRYYCRSFQMAAEVVTAAHGYPESITYAPSRHIRFHSELFDSAPVEVRSMVLDGGPHDGTVVHLLFSEGRLSASAVDFGGPSRPGLPRIAADLLALAMPRGLEPSQGLAKAPVEPGAHHVQLGATRPAEYDHRGRFLDEEILRRVSVISHSYLTAHGFTRAFTESSGMNRMSVEMKLLRHRNPAPGSLLTADAALERAGEKSFVIRHHLFDAQGCVASIEQCLVVVDLATRKLVPVPYDRLALPA